MSVDTLAAALQSLQSEHPDAIGEGIGYLRTRMGSLPEAEFRGAVEQLCSLFYVDTADRPDLQPLLDRAVAVVAGQGPRIVGQLLELMKGSDIKSHLYLARTLAASATRRCPRCGASSRPRTPTAGRSRSSRWGRSTTWRCGTPSPR